MARLQEENSSKLNELKLEHTRQRDQERDLTKKEHLDAMEKLKAEHATAIEKVVREAQVKLKKQKKMVRVFPN